jgi:hypothetical protein
MSEHQDNTAVEKARADMELARAAFSDGVLAMERGTLEASSVMKLADSLREAHEVWVALLFHSGQVQSGQRKD